MFFTGQSNSYSIKSQVSDLKTNTSILHINKNNVSVYKNSHTHSYLLGYSTEYKGIVDQKSAIVLNTDYRTDNKLQK